MKYKPYYSRYINERKRKAKNAYITKVMAGVALALAISSSSFMLVSSDTGTLDAALGEDNEEIVLNLNTDDESNPNDFDLTGGPRFTDENAAGDMTAPNSVDLDNPGENDSPADILNQLYANYNAALDNYYETLGKYNSGEISYGELRQTYNDFIEVKAEAQDAYDAAKAYYDSEYGDFVKAMAEYENEYAQYLMDRKSYESQLREYDEAVKANAEAMEQYNEKMEQYAKDMAEYELALEKWNEFVSGGGYGEDLTETEVEYPEAPKMPSLNLKTEIKPGNAPKEPDKPDFNGTKPANLEFDSVDLPDAPI